LLGIVLGWEDGSEADGDIWRIKTSVESSKSEQFDTTKIHSSRRACFKPVNQRKPFSDTGVDWTDL